MRIFATLVALICCLVPQPAGAGAQEPLTFAFLPIFSPATLVELHKPLKDHLETVLKTPVKMVSAPNFKAFRQRTRDGHYDIIFTAPHLARLAEKETHYRRVVATAHRGSATFIARKDSGIRTIAGIRGKRLALPPVSAIIHHMALKTLRAQGVDPQTEVTIVTTKSHNDPILRVSSGKVHAAAVGKAPWAGMKEKAGEHVVVIGQGVTIPGFMILARPEIDDAHLDALRLAFLSFNETNAGRAYLAQSGYQKLMLISDPDMEEMDFYLREMFPPK